MNWFEEQIKLRKKNDDKDLADAMEDIASSVLHKQNTSFYTDRKKIKNALDEILRYHRLKTREIPDNLQGLEEQMDYLFRPHGIMRRTVFLRDDWYNNAVGAYLGIRKDGVPVALIPNRFSGYSYFDPETGKMVFCKNELSPLKADAIVIDEMSMVDVQLLSSLLRAIPENKRIILVGDPDQLPPVGPGYPFGDMLRSGTLPTVRLTEIFRQAQESLIVMNAHRVNNGEMPDLKKVDKDFFFMRRQSEEAVCQTIRDLCATRLPQKMGIPSDQIQVLTPTRKGGVGTWSLNGILQEALNPSAPTKKERKSGEFTFREGDRVMQIRNNYDIMWKKTDGSAIGTGVFNGDVGTITCIDTQQETVTAIFDDREVDYDFSQLNELEPAYAMTVHKSQGSEYRAVILAAWSGSPYLLNRSVLYTAITRARELLIIVGREEIVATMTENAKKNRRYSGLKLRLQGKVS